MRVRATALFCICVSVCTAFGTHAQGVDATAINLLLKSLRVLVGNQTVTDVTLTGAVRRIVGSDDESGTAVLKSVGLSSSVVLTLPSGTLSEVRSDWNGEPTGTWSGIDGVSHPMAFHNLLTDPAWFFPALPISRGSSSGYTATYVGHETRDGQAVENVNIAQIFSQKSTKGSTRAARLSQIDVFLDSTTFLPAAVTFNVHPDDNSLLDIPLEVRFSDYRTVNSSQIPFHVQKLLNNVLILDLQFSTAELNTGLTASKIQQ